MIWIVGDRGMLGSELREALDRQGTAYVGSDREVDILDPSALSAFAEAHSVDAIVNCAAYTAVDKAEDEPELCRRLNAEGPENLGRLAAARGARIVHISTDYVFDGSGSAPYREDDPIAPQGTYGRTKAQGETRLLAAAPDGVIIRTAWLYGKHGPNFVYTMLRLMGVKDRIGVVADQIGSPTWARDLAETIATIIGAGASASAGADVPPAGIYHFTNAGETSWHQFALEIHRLGRELGILERDCQIDALRTDQYPTKTKRPAYSVLSKEKIAATFGIQVPDWKDSLRGFFTDAFAFSDDQRNLSGLAAYDLTTAKAMLEARRYLYVLYTCQQAVEKNLKTLLCVRGKSAHHHNLGRLAAECEFPASADESQFMDKLTAFYIKGRYQMDVRDLGEDSQRTLSENTYERSVSLCEKIRKHPIFSIW